MRNRHRLRVRSSLAASRGFLLPLVLFSLIILGTLVVAYFWMSRNTQLVAFRMEKGGICRHLCEAAMDEALFGLFRESRKTGSPVAKWFLEHPATPLTLATPLVLRESKNFIPPNILLRVTATARMHDFRQHDSKQSRYYGKEGVGSFQLTVDAELAEVDATRPSQARFHLLRQFDFKIVSMISARSNAGQRTSYSHNFLQDYAFFARRGEEEFQASQGEVANPSRIQLIVAQQHHSPDRRGKIFYGGTATMPRQRFVFLNTSDADRPVLPILPKPEVYRINAQQCLSLFPSLKQKLEAESISLDVLNGLEGVFMASVEPLVASTQAGGKVGQNLEYTRAVLFNSSSGPAANGFPGAELIERNQCANPLFAPSVFEGAIRQRFFYFVYFYLDGSKLDPEIAKELQKDEYQLACLPMPSPPPQDQTLKDFLQGLQNLAGGQGVGGEPCPFLSRLDTDYLYLPRLVIPTGRLTPDSFGKPVFFDKTGAPVDESSEGLQGWNHVNLMARRMLTESTLREIGTIDDKNKVLRLNGCEWVAGDLTIGATGEQYTVSGKGVLLANGNIRINASIRKGGPDDLAVFFTRRGTISVDGSLVEASLIAMGGGSGNVVFLRPSVVRGAFVVDILNSNRWAPGPYRFEYDPLLKGNDDRYVINLTTAHSMQRILEGD